MEHSYLFDDPKNDIYFLKQNIIKHKVATPADWKKGEDGIIVPSVTNEKKKKIYPDGWKTIKSYLRKVPDPSK